jgi:PAS domain S-box-containing protein
MKKLSDESSSAQESGKGPDRKGEITRSGEERFQRLMLEVEDYAIFLLNREGTIMTWNRGAEKMKGYAPDEIIGKNYKLFYSKEDKEAMLPEKLLNHAIQYGKVMHEGWRVRKDGTRFWGNITITALHADDGEITGFLKVTRDLTEKKRAEDNYSNYVEQLKEKNEALKRSEERYHKMVSEVRDYAIILLDPDGKILDWNKGAEALKGYSLSEILGKSFRLFYTREDKEADLPGKLLHQAFTNGRVSHEGWRIRKDGTRFWGSVVITALHDDSGAVIGYTKVTRDLTDKKIAEDKLSNVAEELRQSNEYLKQSEERYHRMIAEVRDYAIILLNEYGEIENWNAGAQFIKGYKAEEVIGKSFRIFYPLEDVHNKTPERLLEEARRNGRAIHEGWRVRKDGTRFWGSVVITALHDSTGKLIGFSKVTRDLTEQKKAEDLQKANAIELNTKNKQLERLNEELSSFAYVAGHDLKEPLRKIQTFSSRLEELEKLSDKGKDYLQRINSSASRMQKLIEDLLSYSQLSNDFRRFESVNLNEVLQLVKSDLEILIQEKKAAIQSTSLPTVQGVSFQIQQVFMNLVANSIKFSKPGESPLITVSSRIVQDGFVPAEVTAPNQKYHMVTLRDNGIGFEQEHADKIFDVFQRLHGKEAYTGTGIGLAIVKKVMQNHGGTVIAEGKPDIGASFHLYFPVN